MSGNTERMEKPKMERSSHMKIEDIYSDEEEETTTTSQKEIVVVNIEIFRNSIIPNNYVNNEIKNTM